VRGHVVNAWVIGPYTISEVAGHGFAGYDGSLFTAEIEGRSPSHEMYECLDHALAEVIGRRWTGPRGAGGGGVDTAAGWFLSMIGAKPAPVAPEMLPPAVEPKDPHCPDAGCLGKLRPAMFHDMPGRLGWTCSICAKDWEIDPARPAEVIEA
jgi:hypothetical protein